MKGGTGEGLLERPWACWVLVAAATLLGAYLRLHGLGHPSFWVDEFFTIARAGSDPLHWTYALGYQPSRLSLWLSGVDLSHVTLDSITQWQSLGVSERAARLGPCWVGIASVPILALLARPVLGGGVAGVAALLVAVAPYHLYWSQMARYYTSEFLLANAFLLLFLRGMQTGSRAWLSAAAACGVLAFSTHFTALFVVGGCLAVTAAAWLLRAPLPNLRRGVVALAASAAICVLMLLLKELESEAPATLGAFSGQSWDPPIATLLLGSILRVEPAIFVAGLGATLLALRRRDAPWLLVAAIAVGVPVGVLVLKLFFPVGERYYFSVLFPWALLAGLWCVEVDRRLATVGGAALGVTGLLVVLVSVGFSAFLYVRDGAGARARWREAFEHVLAHGRSEDPVFVGPGRFQAQYYLRRTPSELGSMPEPGALPPGTWVVRRDRGERRPDYPAPLETKARFEIPSKPWSWVVHVLRVPPP